LQGWREGKGATNGKKKERESEKKTIPGKKAEQGKYDIQSLPQEGEALRTMNGAGRGRQSPWTQHF